MSSLRMWRIPPLAIVLEAFKLLALFIVASYWSANSEFLNAIILLAVFSIWNLKQTKAAIADDSGSHCQDGVNP